MEKAEWERKPISQRYHHGELVWGELIPDCTVHDWVGQFYTDMVGARYDESSREAMYRFVDSPVFHFLGMCAPTLEDVREQHKVEDLQEWTRQIHEQVNEGKLSWNSPLPLPRNYTRALEKKEMVSPWLWARIEEHEIQGHSQRRKYALSLEALCLLYTSPSPRD